ncbi:MAG: glycosyltransferase [Planctomycetia bacterium]|nr:glycosyltransferase [Planctomycetia bacterium]
MLASAEIVLWLAVAVVLVPFAVLAGEALAALLPGRQPTATTNPRPRCAVLVPAHNEATGISATLHSIRAQLEPDDRLLVIADNCTDTTAETARAAGAEVAERTDAERRGKGYALDFGVRQLSAAPPEVVVILDADCTLHPGSMDQLVRQAAASGSPQQAIYLMAAPSEQPTPKQQLSAFAFLFKNQVRPLGLHRLGFPCLLTGSGMAFPWATIQRVPLASGNIVEDMKLGLDLALAGDPPRLCPEALVTSELPTGEQAAVKQRSRWEHGHVRTLLTQAPRLFIASLTQRRPALFGLALELSVPPLSLLFFLWAAVLTAAAAFWLAGGSPAPALTLLAALLAVLLGILASWAKFGRDRLPFATLASAPFYVLWKVPIYLALVFKPQKAWVRTERSAEAKPPEPPHEQAV